MEALSLHQPLVAELTRPQAARVHSVHRRAINLLLEHGQLLSLLHPSLKNGPGALRLAGEQLPPWPASTLVQIGGGLLVGPGEVIRWEGATRWSPPSPPAPVGRAALASAFASATHLLIAQGRQEGLLPALLPVLGRPAPPLQGVAAALTAIAMQGIDHLLAGEWESGVRRLAGLGPGLTPSGDDLLAGYACLLYRAGAPTARLLLPHFASLPTVAQPPLSRHLLRWAAVGVASEEYLAWVDALLSGDGEGALLADVVAHGATSGTDWASGALLALHQLTKEDLIWR